jgi:hypothetical protein
MNLLKYNPNEMKTHIIIINNLHLIAKELSLSTHIAPNNITERFRTNFTRYWIEYIFMYNITI